MRNRMRVGAGMIIVLGAVFVWFFWLSTPKHNITQEGFGQLREGMTAQEVEEVLGAPEGDYGPGKGEILTPQWVYPVHEERTKRTWLAGSLAITVYFDEQGRAKALQESVVYRPYDNQIQKLGQWLGLSKRNPPPTPVVPPPKIIF
jgi:SmpA / OmlA family